MTDQEIIKEGEKLLGRINAINNILTTLRAEVPLPPQEMTLEVRLKDGRLYSVVIPEKEKLNTLSGVIIAYEIARTHCMTTLEAL